MRVGIQQENQALNNNAIFRNEMVDGRMVYAPNDNYKRQEIEKINRHLSFMIRVYFFKYMLDNIKESYLTPLVEKQNRTNEQFDMWIQQIDQFIQNQEKFLRQNEEQLTEFNNTMQAKLTRKDQQKAAARKLDANSDPQVLEIQYENLKQIVLEIQETKTRLNVTKAKGQEILVSLREFKEKLNNYYRGTIRTYLTEYQEVDSKYQQLNEQLVQLFTFSQELMQNQNYEQQNNQLAHSSQEMNNFLQEANKLFLKYFKLLQDLDFQSRMVGIKQEQTENIIKYEVGQCRIQFLEAEIQNRETLKRKLLIVLHGLIARDAVTTLKTTMAECDANFEQIKKHQPYQDGDVMVNYDYELIRTDPRNITLNQDTLEKANLVQRYEREIAEKQVELNTIYSFSKRVKELIQRANSIKTQNQMSFQQMLNNGELTRTKQFQYYQITLMEYHSYHFERQSIQSLLGCMSKHIAFKKVNCCSCYSCCPSCYSKEIHTYNDLYYEDYERIFIKIYRFHHQVQSEITVNDVKEFKLANLPEFLMDYDIIGAYRNDQGFRQEVANNYRENQFNKALHFTISNIANLFALQEIVKIQINEQKHRALITNEFTNVLYAIKQGDLAVPRKDFPMI